MLQSAIYKLKPQKIIVVCAIGIVVLLGFGNFSLPCTASLSIYNDWWGDQDLLCAKTITNASLWSKAKSINNVVSEDDLIYVASSHTSWRQPYEQISIISISKPDSPRLQTQVNLDNEHVQCMTVKNSLFALITSTVRSSDLETIYTLRVFDTSDETKPRKILNVDSHEYKCKDIELVGEHLYISKRASTNILIVDIVEGARIGSFRSNVISSNIISTERRDTLWLVANDSNGKLSLSQFSVLDTSDPVTPIERAYEIIGGLWVDKASYHTGHIYSYGVSGLLISANSQTSSNIEFESFLFDKLEIKQVGSEISPLKNYLVYLSAHGGDVESIRIQDGNNVQKVRLLRNGTTLAIVLDDGYIYALYNKGIRVLQPVWKTSKE